MLYIAIGDGGAAGDQGPGHDVGGNAESLGTLLGKILRINPAASATAPYTIPRDNPFAGRDGVGRDLVVRAAQSVALHVRSQHR